MSFDDPYTGILTRLSPIARRAHDPEVRLWGGVLPPWGPRSVELALGGAGWTDEDARDACVGEAIERLQSYPLPDDEIVEASVADWPRDEPPVGPESWTLFHPEQRLPFAPFTRESRVRWVCFRDSASGEARWIPEEFGFLFHGAGSGPRLAPSYSTGLSCGRAGHPVLLRGLQEVIERDAVVGAWWGSYALEEWPETDLPAVRRPNRRYRYYRVRSPFSDHVTLVTVEGEDRDGRIFAAGSACRETLARSWEKSLLEAIQGFSYVRQLRAERGLAWVDDLSDFAHHAAYYTAHPERLKETVLARAAAPAALRLGTESVGLLRERLGREVLVRLMTPPIVEGDWIVLRVVVPGLQPLHGNHRWPHLGGPLWKRPIAEWASTAPHPFA